MPGLSWWAAQLATETEALIVWHSCKGASAYWGTNVLHSQRNCRNLVEYKSCNNLIAIFKNNILEGKWSRSVMSDSLWPVDCSPPSSSIHGISHQEYWNGLSFPTPWDLPDPGTEPASLGSTALPADSLLTEPSGKPQFLMRFTQTHTRKSSYLSSYFPL